MAIIQDVAPQQPAKVRPDARQVAKQRRRKRLVTIVTVVSLVVLALTATWLVTHHQKLAETSANLNDVNVIKAKVGRLYLLPSDEQPALATVTNEAKLSSSFLGRVKDGDKILIYQTNRKAIAYRPSIDKIVDVEPVSIDAPPAQVKAGTN